MAPPSGATGIDLSVGSGRNRVEEEIKTTVHKKLSDDQKYVVMKQSGACFDIILDQAVNRIEMQHNLFELSKSINPSFQQNSRNNSSNENNNRGRRTVSFS